MIATEPEVLATRIDGRIESIYVVFQLGVHARETIAFADPHNVRVLLDVDSNDMPIAIELVDSFDATDASDGAAIDTQAALWLFGIASQLVAYHRANQQARGNALIRDALSSIRQLPLPTGV